MEGLLSSEKIMMAVGRCRVWDLKNKLVAVITFDANKENRYSFFTSFIMGSGNYVDASTGVSPNRKDLVRIDIHKLLI
jgi:hypothetical protein